MRINKIKFILYILVFVSILFVQSGFIVRAESKEIVVIDFTYNGKLYRYSDNYIAPTDHLVAQEIEARKINKPLDEKMRMIDKCVTKGVDYQNAIEYCFPLLTKRVQEVVDDVSIAPIDSTIKFNPNKKPMFSISKEKVGYELEKESLYRDIYIHLKQGNSGQIVLRPKVVKCNIVAHDNILLTNLRSSFTTEYTYSQAGRCHNIELALSKINGTVLLAGQEFSFNKTVGKRTEENGFEGAKIIVGGEYTEGIGGGVCQASTTLYNAILRADLEPTEVRGHSLSCAYVPPSLDAMVNSYSSDLKFKNTGDTPVFIRAYAKDKKATIEVYGKALPYKITATSITLSSEDAPDDKEVIDFDKEYIKEEMKAGEIMRVSYGHGALKSESYLCYSDKNGKIIDRKLIRRDNYSSVAGVIARVPTAQEIIENEENKQNDSKIA